LFISTRYTFISYHDIFQLDFFWWERLSSGKKF
jgi:hypothetical protein